MQIDNWEKDGKAVWEVEVFEAGYYMVKLKYAGTSRTVWRVSTEEK